MRQARVTRIAGLSARSGQFRSGDRFQTSTLTRRPTAGLNRGDSVPDGEVDCWATKLMLSALVSTTPEASSKGGQEVRCASDQPALTRRSFFV
jgi:hypothetical protein